ncbi:MAG: sulfatase family protein [Candidatus Binatia bacterium]
MRRVLPTTCMLVVLVVVLAVAGVDAWREATAQGWIADSYDRLVRAAFWRRFDRAAPIGLAALVALSLLASTVRRWVPTRREIALPFLLVALVAIGRVLAYGYEQNSPRRPNVLLISIDTLRADRVGADGYERPTSPSLDHRLAAEGVVFEDAWSQSPKTTPSHMTMLTSLYPSVHGIGLWTGTGAAPSLNPRVHTLAEVLKNAGYATAAFTAGAHMHRDRGFVQGFDVYKHGDQLRRALEFLGAHRRRPFFLFVHSYEVHDPYTPPPELAARFAADPVPAIAEAAARIRAGGVNGWPQAHRIFWQPVDAADPRDVRYLSDLYDAGIRAMDDTTLTAILDRLDALGLADDTLVVFTSDHGEAFQEHGTFLHEDLHVETLRVPLVLRFPKRLPAGRRVDRPARLLDVVPTVLDLLMLPVPAQAEGASLAPLARGEEDAAGPDVVFSEYSDAAIGRVFESMRQGPYALIRDGDAVHLYDSGADTGERHDVAAGNPARVQSMGADLDRWREANGRLAARYGPRTGDVAAPSKDTVEQLRALGYVE